MTPPTSVGRTNEHGVTRYSFVELRREARRLARKYLKGGKIIAIDVTVSDHTGLSVTAEMPDGKVMSTNMVL